MSRSAWTTYKVNVIHRDLKTANLLMDENEVVKVADFGASRVKATDGKAMTAEARDVSLDRRPEVISHQKYDHKCDVFSFGILMWELVSGGDIPYPGYTPLQAAVGVVQRGLRPMVVEAATRCSRRSCSIAGNRILGRRPEFEQIVELLKRRTRRRN